MRTDREALTGVAVPHPVRPRRPWRMLAPLALLMTVACGDNDPKAPELSSDPVVNLDGGGARQWVVRPGIVQTLKLLNPRLRTGDTLKLESSLRNVSHKPLDVTHVTCGLEVEGIQTSGPSIFCLAYLHTSRLAPGEEVTSRVWRIVISPPGKYTISVRHLLDPPVSVSADLTVHP